MYWVNFAFGGFSRQFRYEGAVHQNGRLGIGETYWLSNQVHPEYAQKQTTTHTEPELAQFTETKALNSNTSSIPAAMIGIGTFRIWYGLIRWLDENPTHPDHEQVFKFFRADQDDYLQFQSQDMGWAMYCLAPLKSHLPGSQL
jgi:hypothetical protein